MPIPSPFHSRTAPLNEKQEWRDWSGFLAAGSYEPGHEREYYAIRNSAALIDISPLYKYDINGPDAERLVNKIITRDVSVTEVGQIIYSPWCDEAGKLIDDGTVWRLGPGHFRITAADPSLRWFQDCGFGLRAKVLDVSRNLAGLALQGPLSRQILSELIPKSDLANLAYYQLIKVQVPAIGLNGGKEPESSGDGENAFPLTITRTGFTGDLGYELWVSPEHALRLWDRLMTIGQRYGLLPAGMVALDIARIEAGLLLIEVDYVAAPKALTEARKSSPYEAGLGWAVALDKGSFVGRLALLAEQELGSTWALVGLEIDWPALEALFAAHDLPPMVAGRASRSAIPAYNENGRQVGQITSSTFSPILKRYIALATVERAYSRPGTELQAEITVEYTRYTGRATVVRKPFYNPAHKRE